MAFDYKSVEMDTQSFDYWMSQSHYIPRQQQHPTLYDVPPEMSKVPSLSGSPDSSTYDQFPAPLHQAYYSQIVDEPVHFGAYSEFGSDHDSPYCSPRPTQHSDTVYIIGSASPAADKTHTTSGRRRAQNRAAQRAFRERKEKHARDLEVQLLAMTEKYTKLELSHTELNAAHEKLRKTIELLTKDDDAEGDIDDGKTIKSKSNSSHTLRKLLEILHGEIKDVTLVKTEST